MRSDLNCSGNIRFAYCSLSGRVFQTHKSHSNYIASDTAFWLWGMACMMTDVFVVQRSMVKFTLSSLLACFGRIPVQVS